jgi:osmoprotectant transport system substrate-binding protein
MRRTKALTTITAVLALGRSACGGSSGGDPTAEDTGNGGSGGGSAVKIGSANFSESALLAEIYAGALKSEGVEVSTQLNIGSRELYIKGIEDGSIDIVPEYTGVLRDFFAAQEGGEVSASDAEGVYAELKEVVPDGLVVGQYSKAEDKDAVVVTRETAEKYSLKSLGDLADVAGELTLGGPSEWKTRPTGIPGLEKVYGVTFGKFTVTDAGGPQTLNALVDGRVDAGNLFTTNPQIAEKDLVALEDPESLFGSQNIVALMREEVADDTVVKTLDEVGQALDTETLTELVGQIDVDKEDPADVAAQWLEDNDLG